MLHEGPGAGRRQGGARYRRSRRLVLDVIRREGGATRVDVARTTGLSSSAVAAAVSDLLAAGRLDERRPAGPAVARGRPAGVLVPVERTGRVAGLDIGHAHVAVVITDIAGDVLAEGQADVDVDREPGTTFDTLLRLLHAAAAEAGVRVDDLLAVAAGVPGPIGGGSDAIRSPTILSGWVDVHPAREISARVGRPVVIGNDADMGARGELRFGAGRGLRDFVYIKASHGIGAGLMLGGRSYRGAVGIAGEIGHTRLAGATAACRCGNRGCLETEVSIAGLHERVRREVGADRPLDELARTTAGQRMVTEAGETLGRVVADLCNCLNPRAVLLGGELGALGAPVIAGVRAAIDRHAQPAIAHSVTVRQAQLGPRAERLGAAWAAIEQAQQPA